jgi:hypothetical protein
MVTEMACIDLCDLCMALQAVAVAPAGAVRLPADALTALPMSVARGIFRDVVRGVEHMHARGVAHRDLKVDNILMFGVQLADVAIRGAASTRVRVPTLTSRYVSLQPTAVVAGEAAVWLWRAMLWRGVDGCDAVVMRL